MESIEEGTIFFFPCGLLFCPYDRGNKFLRNLVNNPVVTEHHSHSSLAVALTCQTVWCHIPEHINLHVYCHQNTENYQSFMYNIIIYSLPFMLS
jgi:hypothetical protein